MADDQMALYVQQGSAELHSLAAYLSGRQLVLGSSIRSSHTWQSSAVS